MQHEMYDRLQRCRNEMALSGVPGWNYPSIKNLAAVFVPVRPQPGAPVPFTALIVGQATRGYNPAKEPCLRTFEKTTARNVELVEKYLLAPRWPFWRWTRAVLAGAYDLLGHEATRDRLLGCFGWSNLAKIGDVKGNPPAWTVEGQTSLAVEALHSEIAQMRPTIVIACVGAFGLQQGKPIFEGVFGRGIWDGTSLGQGRICGVPVVFAQHPHTLLLRGQWASTIDEVSKRIAGSAMR